MLNQTLPTYVSKYFWGDNLSELSFEKNKKYVLETILERGNRDSIRWLFSQTDKNAILKQLPTLKLSKKSANFWQTYLS